MAFATIIPATDGARFAGNRRSRMAHLMNVKYHILRDVKEHRVVEDDTRASQTDADLRNNRMAFVCLLTHPDCQFVADC
jgi:hypothetical protein